MSTSRISAVSGGDDFISPHYTTKDWKILDLSKPANADWQRAVDIFHDRIQGRFLAPIEAMRNHADQMIAEFSGFTILAIDCLLIETLGQFYKGIDQTPARQHEQHFIDFFQQSKYFSAHFNAATGAIVYKHFRCGILHQAQTKKKSKVRYGEPSMVQLVDPADINQGLIIDRDKLHLALLAEVSDYESLLRSPQSAVDHQRRSRFVQKWAYIVP